jgi:hypothetical protein
MSPISGNSESPVSNTVSLSAVSGPLEYSIANSSPGLFHEQGDSVVPGVHIEPQAIESVMSNGYSSRWADVLNRMGVSAELPCLRIEATVGCVV